MIVYPHLKIKWYFDVNSLINASSKITFLLHDTRPPSAMENEKKKKFEEKHSRCISKQGGSRTTSVAWFRNIHF